MYGKIESLCCDGWLNSANSPSGSVSSFPCKAFGPSFVMLV